jgi:hypothetical protein
MTRARHGQLELPVAMDAIIRAHLQAVRVPEGLRERIRAIIANESEGEAFSHSSQWRM